MIQVNETKGITYSTFLFILFEYMNFDFKILSRSIFSSTFMTS